MSFVSMSVPLSDSTLHGIREQILDNASTIFPHEVGNSTSWQTNGIVKPHEIFRIVISGTEQMAARLLCGGPNPKVLAIGSPACNVHNALCRLLTSTCTRLDWYIDNVLDDVKNPEECEQGSVDLAAVTEGFHFAAEQRIIAEISSSRLSSERSFASSE